MSEIKRYAESRTQDEMGDMQDGVYESPTGDYVKWEDVKKLRDDIVALSQHHRSMGNRQMVGPAMYVKFQIADQLMAFAERLGYKRTNPEEGA